MKGMRRHRYLLLLHYHYFSSTLDHNSTLKKRLIMEIKSAPNNKYNEETIKGTYDADTLCPTMYILNCPYSSSTKEVRGSTSAVDSG